jgi:acetylornithine deacetylase/succinyl-diaminopimelate desuccinylase-like protein
LSLDPVETLQRLIQTPSVNPMGRDVTGPEHGESRMTDLLVDICEQQGWHYSRQQVHPGRDNLLALIEGYPSPTGGGELLLWDVHQDTVPVEGMTIDPFAGELRDGRVYGRGACDVKGSMAAMLAALSRLPAVDHIVRPTIILACTVNEECGFTGATALTRTWNDRLAATRSGAHTEAALIENFFSRPPDAAIVAEPTDFAVIVAHQGVVRWRCHTIGRAAHTSRPDMGVNAIYAMAQIISAIERFHVAVLSTAPEHPLCGRPSVCVSTIRGGVGINTVPDRATIEIDRRLGPRESPVTAYDELVRYLANNADVGRCRVEHDPPFMQSIGLSDQHNRPLAERLTNVVHKHGRAGTICGVPFGTDAAAISSAAVPTIVFGPGSIDQAHTADEFIEIDELNLATEIFYRIASEGLSSSGS